MITESEISAPRRTDASTPIADHGLLADCNSAALVSRDGSVDWLCFPRYDSDAIFARLLDPAAGHWSIRPVADEYEVARRYVPGTLIVETTFRTATGTVRLRDGMAAAERQRGHALGYDAPHELLRGIEGVDGEVELVMELAPRPEYGLITPLIRLQAGGARTFGSGRVSVRSAVPLAVADGTMYAAFTVRAGDELGFSLRSAAPEDRNAPEPTPAEGVMARIADTGAAWRSWEAEHDVYHGEHHDLVQHSARILKGLTYRPTGAIVAAPTTSLPETVGGERNWDYRFSWIRDSSLTLEALYIGACSDEAEEFVSFMTSAAGGRAGEGSLQIMYGIGGEHDLSERVLGHLRGWRDSAPVRVGNGAWDQVQLDVYGELLNMIFVYRERLGELHPEIQAFVAELADTAARRWREQDSGIWEMRGEPRHHLSSKVMCWVALDRAVRLAPALGEHGVKAAAWALERDRVRAAILERGWSEGAQAYAQSFEADELDGAALLMPIYGFLPADDPRMRSTIEAIARDLTVDGLVLRYLADEGVGADGLSGEE